MYHNAGLAGTGGSSYIDSVILRDRDANTAWESQADGTLEERVYLLPELAASGTVSLPWRGDFGHLVPPYPTGGQATPATGKGCQQCHPPPVSYGYPQQLQAPQRPLEEPPVWACVSRTVWYAG